MPACPKETDVLHQTLMQEVDACKLTDDYCVGFRSSGNSMCAAFCSPSLLSSTHSSFLSFFYQNWTGLLDDLFQKLHRWSSALPAPPGVSTAQLHQTTMTLIVSRVCVCVPCRCFHLFFPPSSSSQTPSSSCTTSAASAAARPWSPFTVRKLPGGP